MNNGFTLFVVLAIFTFGQFITSCDRSCQVSEELELLLQGKPEWYQCLVTDLAELYNESLDAQIGRQGISKADPIKLLVADSIQFNINIDYKRQREIMARYNDSLLFELWGLGYTFRPFEPETLRPLLSFKPQGIFMDHIKEMAVDDSVFFDLHITLYAMGTDGIDVSRVLKKSYFNLDLLSHRYALMMLLMTKNDNLERATWDFDGPKYYDPREPFDEDDIIWQEEESL